MNNNRQIGLDGKSFIHACLRRGAIFVFFLLIYGGLNAFADILKLTGSSGAAMSPFTTTLLIYDFIVSLLLIVVVFYAFFLECGASVPLLRHKPIVVFGLFRLGYYILLAYYVCYRALFCLTHPDIVRPSLFFFYAAYFVVIFCCIMANSYIYNILTRNVIRRNYRKTFHRLATFGLVAQIVLPITYIIARATMVDAGDEFFTRSMCDLLRLCICPILLSSIWFLFLHSVNQIDEVFGEVDDALRNKRYQITYSAIADGKNGKKKETAEPVAAAAFLPAPSKTAAMSGTPNPVQSDPQHTVSFNAQQPSAEYAAPAQPVQSAPVMSPAERAFASRSPEEFAAAQATITDAATEMNPSQPTQQIPVPTPQEAPAVPSVPVIPEDILVQQGGTTMAYVAETAPDSDVVAGVRIVPVVQEFNPFPEKSVPLHTGRKTVPQHRNGNKNSGGQNAKVTPGGQNRSRQPAAGSQNQRLNQNRSGQNRSNRNRSSHR